MILDLALDRDGILHVAARKKATGLEARISIDQAVPRYGKAELEQARARIGALFGETIEASAGGSDADGTDPALAALLARAAAALDAAGEEDRSDMIDLIEAVRDAGASGDAAALQDARQQLTDLLFYLET